MQADPNCVFCKIVRGEIPSRKVYEDADILAGKPIDFRFTPATRLRMRSTDTQQRFVEAPWNLRRTIGRRGFFAAQRLERHRVGLGIDVEGGLGHGAQIAREIRVERRILVAEVEQRQTIASFIQFLGRANHVKENRKRLVLPKQRF